MSRQAAVSPLRRMSADQSERCPAEDALSAWLPRGTPFGIITAENDGRVIASSPEATRHFGNARAGSDIAELVAPEHRQATRSLLASKGGCITVRSAAAGLRLEVRAVPGPGFVALYTTVTEPQQTGAAPDSLLDCAPMGLGFWDRELRFQFVNRALAEITGYAPDAHAGRTVEELLPEMDGAMMRALRDVVETGTPLIDQEESGYTLSRPGVLRHWSVSYYPIRLEGKIVGAGAIFNEITRLKQAETEIARANECERVARSEARAAEKRAAFLARAATVLASSVDYEATLANVARLAVPDIADWAAVDMVDAHGEVKRLAIAHTDNHKVELAMELHRRYPPDADSPLRRVIETGEPEIVERVPASLLEAYSRDEEHLRLLRTLDPRSWIVVPVRGDSGNTLGSITLLTAESGRHLGRADLRLANELANRVSLAIRTARLFAEAEQRRAEAEAAVQSLRRANADLEQFAWLTSHDLQEPLRSVTSFAQLLERRHAGHLPPEARGYLGHIVEGARRMSHLIHDLLEYAEVSRDDGPNMADVDMESVLEQGKDSLGDAIAASGASITHDPLPVLRRANHAQMHQLLSNLLTNSIRYCRPEESPRIHVSAVRVKDEGWHFSVRDNGQGFDPKYHDRIFGVFKRLHGREVPGTGMGLALCHRIVERHGGRIWAEASPGEGATFHFTIPD